MKRIMILVLAMTTGLGALAYPTHSAPRWDDVKVIRITAKKFDFTPSEISVKKGVPVALELTSSDRVHGFSLPDFKLTAKIEPGKVTRVVFTPDKAGEFTFSCNIFCGSGHEDMAGKLIVADYPERDSKRHARVPSHQRFRGLNHLGALVSLPLALLPSGPSAPSYRQPVRTGCLCEQN